MSRVALLTGLDRKEVRRVRSAALASRAEPDSTPRADRLSRVLSAWHQDPDFVDENGEPRTLSRQGPHPSFESLVRRYGGDVAVTTIARELERGGAIERRHDGSYRARTRYFMPSPVDSLAVTRSGEVLEDFGATVCHNLLREKSEPSRFEGRATSRHVSADSLAAFRSFVEHEAQALLERVDAWLTAHEDPNGEDALRLGLGVYAVEARPTKELHGAHTDE